MTRYEKFRQGLIDGKTMEFICDLTKTVILKFIPIPSIDGDVVVCRRYNPKEHYAFYEYTKGVDILEHFPLSKIKFEFFNPFNVYGTKIILKIDGEVTKGDE